MRTHYNHSTHLYNHTNVQITRISVNSFVFIRNLTLTQYNLFIFFYFRCEWAANEWRKKNCKRNNSKLRTKPLTDYANNWLHETLDLHFNQLVTGYYLNWSSQLSCILYLFGQLSNKLQWFLDSALFCFDSLHCFFHLNMMICVRSIQALTFQRALFLMLYNKCVHYVRYFWT